MKCNNGHEMINLGNVDRVIFTSNPPQRDEVWICERCRVKRIVRVTIAHAQVYPPDLSGFEELKDSTNEH